MRLFKLFILLFLFVSELQAQEYTPVYSQYMFNGLTINPAYTGSREVFTASVMHRSQWVGFDGAPVMQTLSAHAPLKKENIALGVLLFNEKVAVTKNIGFYTNYAYRFNMWKGKFSLGFKAGVSVRESNYTSIATSNMQVDPVFSQNANALLPNFGFGFYYYSDKLFFGGSIPLLLSYSHLTNEDEYEMSHNFKDYNFLITSGVLFEINKTLKLKPSFLLKYHKYSPIQLDINSNVIIQDFLWIGASYRLQDAFVGLLEYQINDQLKVGYSYDYTFGDLQKYNSGSHEILIQYEFGYKIRAVNPRYF